MLFLTRRIGETIMIGDDIKMIILGIKGNQIRMGFDAKKDVTIHRSEIYEKIQKEKEQNQ